MIRLRQGRGHTTHLWDNRKDSWEVIALNANDVCDYDDNDGICEYDGDYDACDVDVENNLWDEGKDGREVWKQVFSRNVRHLWCEIRSCHGEITKNSLIV